MTNEEAIDILERERKEYIVKGCKLDKALDVAIDALKQTKQIGCTGCEYYDQQQTRLICHECKRYYSDKYKGGEDE